jgi:hypothetical protein
MLMPTPECNPPVSLKFPQLLKPKPLELRTNLKITGLPLNWTTNLSDREVHEVYQILLRRQFFVGLPDCDFHAEGPTVSISVNPRFDEVKYRDGYCRATMLMGTVHLWYRTSREWQISDK